VHTALPGVILCFPAAHAVHAVPSCPENPAGHLQSDAAALAAFESELVGHAVHVAAAMAAIAGENFPFGHDAQASLPDCGLNFPATQLVHANPSGPENPTGHRHTVLPAMRMAFVGHDEHTVFDVAPISAEKVLPGHDVHSVALPTRNLYFPASQSVQPAAPLKVPAIHKQLLGDPLESTDVILAGHELHVDSNVAPMPVENLATPHATHTLFPGSTLYFPAAHFVQTLPSAPSAPALHVQSLKAELPRVWWKEFSGQAVHWVTSMAPVS